MRLQEVECRLASEEQEAKQYGKENDHEDVRCKTSGDAQLPLGLLRGRASPRKPRDVQQSSSRPRSASTRPARRKARRLAAGPRVVTGGTPSSVLAARPDEPSLASSSAGKGPSTRWSAAQRRRSPSRSMDLACRAFMRVRRRPTHPAYDQGNNRKVARGVRSRLSSAQRPLAKAES